MLGLIVLVWWLGRYFIGTPTPMHRRSAPWITASIGGLLLLYGGIGLVSLVARGGQVAALGVLGVAAALIAGGLQIWEATKVAAWRAEQQRAPLAPRLDLPAPPRPQPTQPAAVEPSARAEGSAWRIEDLFPPIPPDGRR